MPERPQSMEELFKLSVGDAVFDAHEPIPAWIRENGIECLSIHRELSQLILSAIRPSWKASFNKIVYVAAKDEKAMTLIANYDDHGCIYTILF